MVGQIKVSVVTRWGTNRATATVIWTEDSQEIETLTLPAFMFMENYIEYVGQSSHGLNIILQAFIQFLIVDCDGRVR